MVSSGTRNEATPRRPSPNRSGGPTRVGVSKPASTSRQAAWAASRSRSASQVNKAAIRRGRGQPLPVIAGEYFLQQDRQRPAIEHDVVIGQHEPVPIVCGADQRHPKGRLVGEVADRGTFGGAHPLDLLIDIDTVGAQFDIPPGRHGIGRDDLHRLVELFAESGHQVRMPVDHRVHRIAQPVLIERDRLA